MAYPEHFRGWLLKWTNYIKGYQKRWFVLSNGLLSYYRAQEEMAHTCRGTVNLTAAFIDDIDSTNFVITNGPQVKPLEYDITRSTDACTNRLVYYFRASSEVERQDGGLLSLSPKPCCQDLEKTGATEAIATEVEGYNEEVHLDPTLKENLSLFRLTADAMVKASEGYLQQARSVEKRWRRTCRASAT
ncbi:Oxysterol-binding protein 2 [Geodia barretti]|uniref:Oxysterol-binding protein 2 n=1 Tax=Geodia barretti TaxID=519541 RepID=A0AA35TQF5_GEOBA|nr:Oxysterol-binding protein 2 [Geodia barretti]